MKGINSSKMKVGIALLTKENIQVCTNVAHLAEESGFDTIWLAEAHHFFRVGGQNWDARSSTSIGGIIGMQTSRINVGLAVVNPYTRHPALLAMEIATLDEATHGRLLIALGAAKAGLVHLEQSGLQEIPPVSVFRETLLLIRGLLSGSEFRFTGDVFSAEAPKLIGTRTYRPNPPIYMGSTGRFLTRLAGELFDGIITPSVSSPTWISTVLQEVTKGAKRVGRNLVNFDIGSYLLCSVHEDGDRARNEARRMAAVYLAGKSMNIGKTAERLLDAAGIRADELSHIADSVKRGDITAAMEAVDDDLLSRAFPIVGDPEECLKALIEYRDAGMNMPILEVVGDMNHIRVTIELLAKQIVPALREAD